MSQQPRATQRIKLTVSPDAEKYVRRDAPIGVRRMAARGALPLEPIELATVLFILGHDPDEQVKTTALASLSALPAHLLEVVASGPTHPVLLSFLAKEHRNDEPTMERIALNAAADDLTIAFLASLPMRRVVDIVSTNQERMLRCEEIVESLGSNPLTGRAVIDRILGFLGIDAPDEGSEADQMVDPEELSEEAAEAAVRAILGNELAGVAGALASESDEFSDEDLKGNLFATVQKMNVMQKIKIARSGGKEARSLLVKDRNKVVAISVMANPKMTDTEVVAIAQSRGVSDEILRLITVNREWTKSYQVKLALATNPKSPQSIATKFLNYLQDKDLKIIMKSKDVPSAVSVHARRILTKKGKV